MSGRVIGSAGVVQICFGIETDWMGSLSKFHGGPPYQSITWGFGLNSNERICVYRRLCLGARRKDIEPRPVCLTSNQPPSKTLGTNMATDNNGNVKPTLLHLGPLSLENVEKVRQINQAVLPLGYSQRFYQDLLDPQLAELCQVATTTHDGRDLVIGALCVDWDTKQQQKENTTPTDLWIMTLAVLAPFRDMGIGSRLLQSLLQGCRERGIVKVQLHVQTSNDDAIRFYTQRFGFIHNGKIENYYPRLDPPDCFVLLKVLDDGPRPTLIQTESTSLTTTPTGSNSRKRRKLSRETFLLPTSVL